MNATRHFHMRAVRRALRPEVLGFILQYGVEICRAGARFLTVIWRVLPSGLNHDLVEHALDWIVVTGDDGQLVTCYRRAHALRYITRKTKIDRYERFRRPPHARGAFRSTRAPWPSA